MNWIKHKKIETCSFLIMFILIGVFWYSSEYKSWREFYEGIFSAQKVIYIFILIPVFVTGYFSNIKEIIPQEIILRYKSKKKYLNNRMKYTVGYIIRFSIVSNAVFFIFCVSYFDFSSNVYYILNLFLINIFTNFTGWLLIGEVIILLLIITYNTKISLLISVVILVLVSPIYEYLYRQTFISSTKEFIIDTMVVLISICVIYFIIYGVFSRKDIINKRRENG